MSETAGAARRFVILAVPRSGSNMLCTLLDSHPGILCHHEVFNPKGIRLALALRGTDFSLGTVEERARSPEVILERVWERHLGFPCVGFKLTHRQHEAIYRRLLADASIDKVVLRRRNRLKTYVSNRVAEALSQWEVYREADLAPGRERVRVEVDPRHFLESVAFDDAYYAEIRAAVEAGGHRSIELTYERLGSREEQNAVLRFLGVAPTADGLRARSVKQNSCDLRDLVANYEELRRLFGGTEFEAELLSTAW